MHAIYKDVLYISEEPVVNKSASMIYNTCILYIGGIIYIILDHLGERISGIKYYMQRWTIISYVCEICIRVLYI